MFYSVSCSYSGRSARLGLRVFAGLLRFFRVLCRVGCFSSGLRGFRCERREGGFVVAFSVLVSSLVESRYRI